MCRTFPPPAMGVRFTVFGQAGHADPLDGWRCSSQKWVISRLIQVRQHQTNESGFVISAIKKYMTSKRCDRHNCYYYHVAGTLRPFTDIVPLQKQVSSQPTPFMQMEVSPPSNYLPSMHRQNIIPEHAVSNLPPKTQVSVPHGPPDHAPSNETNMF